MLALYLQCSVTSFYHWEVPVIFFEKFKQLWFQFARIFSLFLTHSFYIEAYPFSLYAICYQIPWGKQLEKWEVIFFPRLFLFPQESANLCVFLSIFFFHFAMSFLHMPWSAQLSVHINGSTQLSVRINGRKTKVYLVYRYLTQGNPLDSLPWLGRLLSGCPLPADCSRKAGFLQGPGEDKQADQASSCPLTSLLEGLPFPVWALHLHHLWEPRFPFASTLFLLQLSNPVSEPSPGRSISFLGDFSDGN